MLLWIGNALKTQTLRFETVYTKECSYSNVFVSLWWYLNFYTVWYQIITENNIAGSLVLPTVQQECDHTSNSTIFSPSCPCLQLHVYYMLYGKIGEQTVVSYVYLKVFPPFFIQVVSIFEELHKYKDTNQIHDATDVKDKFMRNYLKYKMKI